MPETQFFLPANVVSSGLLRLPSGLIILNNQTDRLLLGKVSTAIVGGRVILVGEDLVFENSAQTSFARVGLAGSVFRFLTDLSGMQFTVSAVDVLRLIDNAALLGGHSDIPVVLPVPVNILTKDGIYIHDQDQLYLGLDVDTENSICYLRLADADFIIRVGETDAFRLTGGVTEFYDRKLSKVLPGVELTDAATVAQLQDKVIFEALDINDRPLVPVSEEIGSVYHALNSLSLQSEDWKLRKPLKSFESGTAGAVLQNDEIVLVSSENNFDVTLPVPLQGHIYTVKKLSSTAEDRVVTIFSPAPSTIDGEVSYQLTTQYQYVTLVFDGDNYWVVGAS